MARGSPGDGQMVRPPGRQCRPRRGRRHRLRPCRTPRFHLAEPESLPRPLRRPCRPSRGLPSRKRRGL